MILAVCPNPAIDTLVYVNDITRGEVNRIVKENSFPGGKGVHVGLGVKTLREDVIVLGIWGGLTGQWIKDELQNKGIKCIGPTVKSWTRICQTFQSDSDFDETEILGVGPTIDDDIFSDFMKIYQDTLEDVEIVSMSGSCPPGAPENAYAQMIELSNQYDIPSVLDCTGIQLSNALLKQPTACHLNYSEAYDYTGMDKIEDQITELKKYLKLSIVTKGAEGLVISNEEKMIWCKVEIDHVISPVGSGDAVTAGLVVGMKNKFNLEKMARLTVACGGANCLRSELGMFYEKDVKFLREKVDLKISHKING